MLGRANMLNLRNIQKITENVETKTILYAQEKMVMNT